MFRAGCFFLLFYTCTSWTLVSAAEGKPPQLGYKEGDVCKEEGGVTWTCKKFLECPKAKEAYQKNKILPIVCSYKKTINSLITCCDPGVKPITKRSKSKEMCEKYGKSVRVNKTNGWGDEYELEDRCVATEPLIAFGIEAEAKEFPHMALIGVGKKGSQYWGCGGSLISERFVLSAAHCNSFGYRGQAEWVRLGEYNIQSHEDELEGNADPMDFKIIEIINHPGWKLPSLYNDIALFKLEKEVTFSEFVRPACLQSDHFFPNSTYTLATGWGKTENTAYGVGSAVLMKVNLTIFPREYCSSSYSRAIGSKKLEEGVKDQPQLCAGDTIKKSDVCQGDSGGPLQIRLKEPYCMYSVLGVVSFGPTDCGDGGLPSVFSRVSYYLPWIESIVWP